MGKKIIILLLMILVLIIGGVGGYLIYSWKNKNIPPSLSSMVPQISQKEEVTADLTYVDDSGFSFGYPKGINVSDVTPDDEIYYSVLALAKSGSQITITAKDTTTKTVDEWVKNGIGTNPSLYGATTLGGVSAKQYTSGSKLYTVAIDQGVLYLIEGPASPSQGGPKDGSFWESTQNLVASTFTFGGTSTGGPSNTIYEEEEVVQ